MKKYGLRRKREIWKAEAILRKYRRLARRLAAERNEAINILKVHPSKVNTVYHGISTEKFKKLKKKSVDEYLQSRFGITRDFIFHASKYRPTKNIPNILKALSLIEKKPLFVIGGDLNIYKSRILYLIKRYGLEEDVMLTGWLNDEEMLYLYNGAKAFIFPSFHESFGFPILEAMACGTPVITSNTYSAPEIAGKAGIYVNPYDVNSISATIEKVISDEHFRNKKSKESIKQAAKFSWEKCARETLKVYKKAVE